MSAKHHSSVIKSTRMAPPPEESKPKKPLCPDDSQIPVIPFQSKNRMPDLDMIPDILECAAEGAGLAEIAVRIGVSLHVLKSWAASSAPFAEALVQAETIQRAWWEKMGRVNIFNQNFNTGLYMINMMNRNGWKRNEPPAVTVQNNIQNNVTGAVTGILSSDKASKVISSMSVKELAALDSAARILESEEEASK